MIHKIINSEEDYFYLLNKYEIVYKVEPKTIKVICPFHNDTRLSMAIYRDSLVWKCFMKGKDGKTDCMANGKMKQYAELEQMLLEKYGY